MNTFCVAVFVAVVAAAHGSGIGLGLGLGGVDSAAVLSGPSGTVGRAGILAPAGIAAGPALLAAGPALAAPLVSQDAAQLALELSVPAGSGLEGQWIPDINEKLYDDGSYRLRP